MISEKIQKILNLQEKNTRKPRPREVEVGAGTLELALDCVSNAGLPDLRSVPSPRAHSPINKKTWQPHHGRWDHTCQ
jgi:hypothetical protein